MSYSGDQLASSPDSKIGTWQAISKAAPHCRSYRNLKLILGIGLAVSVWGFIPNTHALYQDQITASSITFHASDHFNTPANTSVNTSEGTPASAPVSKPAAQEIQPVAQSQVIATPEAEQGSGTVSGQPSDAANPTQGDSTPPQSLTNPASPASSDLNSSESKACDPILNNDQATTITETAASSNDPGTPGETQTATQGSAVKNDNATNVIPASEPQALSDGTN
ncbi:MAG: hypothetical protein M0Z55_05790 [Peptococcaceae bacterium]|nr:hypothetical protein [Peptococcaceae bacterium]